jgi:hypothetical protein
LGRWDVCKRSLRHPEAAEKFRNSQQIVLETNCGGSFLLT